jgi:hypothetical protein
MNMIRQINQEKGTCPMNKNFTHLLNNLDPRAPVDGGGGTRRSPVDGGGGTRRSPVDGGGGTRRSPVDGGGGTR